MNKIICKRCIMDTTAPNISFDDKGICNYCKTHDALDKSFPLNGNHIKIINKIKYKGKNNKYDCVIGLSGGRDSTYLLYLTKKFGLKPLAVHFNDGFGNPVAGKNIQNAINISNTDLRTITSDWRESKDIKISPLMNITFSKSHKIFVNSKETKKLIPSRYHHKTEELLAIGIDDLPNINNNINKNKKLFNICYAGNLINLKGLLIALKTFSEIKKNNNNTVLTIIGSGPIEFELKQKAKI